MFGIIWDAARAVWLAITRARNLAAENVALCHQLDVVLRPARPRRRLKLTDHILWVWLSRIWSGWKDSLRIVQPESVIGWHRRDWRLYWTWRSKRRGPGRPLIPQDVRELIRRMSAENAWGAPRLHGEILKLGIDISQATVAKYMVRHDKPPSQNWRTFLDNHVTTLASIDFFTVPTIRFGVLYIFLVLAHDRRRILRFNVTANPTAEWTARQITEAFPYDTLEQALTSVDRPCAWDPLDADARQGASDLARRGKTRRDFHPGGEAGKRWKLFSGCPSRTPTRSDERSNEGILKAVHESTPETFTLP